MKRTGEIAPWVRPRVGPRGGPRAGHRHRTVLSDGPVWLRALISMGFFLALPITAQASEGELPGDAPASADTSSAAVRLAPPAASPAAPPRSTLDHEALLGSFRERLSGLTDQVRSVEGRVGLLKGVVVDEPIGRTRAVIVHKNEMGSGFVLERATYMLDGGVLLERENDDGSLDANKEFQVFNGPIAAGPHRLHVQLVFRGSSFGVFTYMRGYRFRVESRYSLEAADGRETWLHVVSHQNPDLTAAPADRLAVRYELAVTNPAAAPQQQR